MQDDKNEAGKHTLQKNQIVVKDERQVRKNIRFLRLQFLDEHRVVRLSHSEVQQIPAI
jgi:hypothetical protein